MGPKDKDDKKSDKTEHYYRPDGTERPPGQRDDNPDHDAAGTHDGFGHESGSLGG
jgi:hypothetical protein